VAAAALALFAWLAVCVSRGAPAFDSTIRGGVHSLASPVLTWAMRGITLLGSEWLLIPFGLLAVWRLAATGRKHAAALLAVSALGGEALTQILKAMFHRSRPEAYFGLNNPENYSFPSGHTIAACCFWGVLAAILAARSKSGWAKRALYALGMALAAAVGFSRVYLGMHYPSDVLAGYAVAAIWLAAMREGYGVWLRRGSRRGKPIRSEC